MKAGGGGGGGRGGLGDQEKPGRALGHKKGDREGGGVGGWRGGEGWRRDKDREGISATETS